MKRVRRPSLFRSALDRLVDDDVRSRASRVPTRLNEYGYDDFGFTPRAVAPVLAVTRLLYRSYFRVRTHGISNVPEGGVLLIANHGGQLPVDGMMIATAMMLDAEPPRIVRAMVERWVPTLPFASTLFYRVGQVVGNREDCRRLLESGEVVLVFPEGARGSGKTIWHRYELQEFGLGFMRLALETGAPIVPVGVVGSEESIPSVYDWRALARLVGAPYVPVPATLPLLGPLSMLPLPTRFDIRFGEPIRFEGDPDGPSVEVADKVQRVRDAVAGLIAQGLEERRGVFDLGLSRWLRGESAPHVEGGAPPPPGGLDPAAAPAEEADPGGDEPGRGSSPRRRRRRAAEGRQP